MRRFFPSLFSLSALLLLAVSTSFLLEANKPHSPVLTAPTVTTAPIIAPPPAEALVQNPPEDIFSATRRPLFSATRRMPEIADIPEVLPEAPQRPAMPAPLPTPPQITMIGVLEDSGQLKALIKDSSKGEQWVETGAEIDGWRVVTITSQSITLQLNDESVDIYTVD